MSVSPLTSDKGCSSPFHTVYIIPGSYSSGQYFPDLGIQPICEPGNQFGGGYECI